MVGQWIVWVGAAAQAGMLAAFIAAVARGRAGASRVTWSVWGTTSWIALIASLSAQIDAALILTAMAALIPTFVVLATFVPAWRGMHITPPPAPAYQRIIDQVSLLACAVSLAVWWLTDDPVTALLLMVAVNVIAAAPTFMRAWDRREVLTPYAAGVVIAVCTFAALDRFAIAEWIFTLYLLVMCTTVCAVIILRGGANTPARHGLHTPGVLAVSGGVALIGAAVALVTGLIPQPTPTSPDADLAVATILVAALLTGGARAAIRQVGDHSGDPVRARRAVIGIVSGVAAMGVSAAVLVVGLALPLPTDAAAGTAEPGSPQLLGAAGTHAGEHGAATREPLATDSPTTSPDVAEQPSAGNAIPALGPAVATSPTPGFVSITPSGRQAWIAHRDHGIADGVGTGMISVLDTTVAAVVATVPIPAGPPRFITFCPDERLAFVSVYHEGRDDLPHVVAVIDTATLAQVAEIPVGRRPFAGDCSPDGSTVAIPSHDDGRLDVIDTATLAVRAQVAVPPNPHWVAYDTLGRLWTANHESNMITVLDAASFAQIEQVAAPTSPHSIAVSPDGSRLAVVCFDSNDLWLVDTATAADGVVGAYAAHVPVGSGPQDVAWTLDGARVITTDVYDDRVSIIDAQTATVTAQVPAGDGPTSVDITVDGTTAWVTLLNNAALVPVQLSTPP